MRILERHERDFHTLTRSPGTVNVFDDTLDGSGLQSVKTRISNAIFDDEIPDPLDALTFCWGAVRQVERYADVETLSTPRDFGLHYVDEHLLFTAAHDALCHLDLVERLLEEIKSFQWISGHSEEW